MSKCAAASDVLGNLRLSILKDSSELCEYEDPRVFQPLTMCLITLTW
jgi:hypothetical protein